ncbi:hypothetical protein [Nocardiopsis sp. NPDC006938]|uniref:hypothetical protein n=1 Tax=Nocardiopsis sp. NPDC006938 TaxID=3364337 RepID=UPI0036CFF9D0
MNSPTDLNQLAAEQHLSPRSHGRRLWRHLCDRRAALEEALAQVQADGVTDRALQVREGEHLQELEETQAALSVLERIGPFLSDRGR